MEITSTQYAFALMLMHRKNGGTKEQVSIGIRG